MQDFPLLQLPLNQSLISVIEQMHVKKNEIEAWFDAQWQQTPPPFYASVDLRNATFKVASIDTNLFPAGFNNLDTHAVSRSIEAAKQLIQTSYPSCQKILLVPENHTRNQPYFMHLDCLSTILKKAGFEVRIGSLLPNLEQSKQIQLDSDSGREVRLEPILRQGNLIKVANFTPDLVILNHDLADGVPDILKNLSQPILPPLTIGWSNRLKSDHFNHYQKVATDFALWLGIDPWLINPYFRSCKHVNFMTRDGEACLISHAESVYEAVLAKYREYKILYHPFIVIKADRGTYGIGVMMINQPSDIEQLNRKDRKRMATSKGGQRITEVIIQEGIYTFEGIGEAKSVAEPVIYLIGKQVVGSFYRVHPQRGPDENLNSPGMHFAPSACANLCNQTQTHGTYLYSIIARLATLAAARELLNE